jgi:hypothetical protein
MNEFAAVSIAEFCDEPILFREAGFDACVRRAFSTEGVRFLRPEQAPVLQTINSLRDAARHHPLSLSEGRCTCTAQSGVTLFRDILNDLKTTAAIRLLKLERDSVGVLRARQSE